MTFSPGLGREAATLGKREWFIINRNAVAPASQRKSDLGWIPDELRALLGRHRIEWDEQYVWD
jgi:hypothetical protein